MTASAPLVIVGGGLAGSLAALLLAERRPDFRILLLEACDSFGGNHTWSFFDSDVPPETRHLVEALQPVRWPRHYVRFPGRERGIDLPYNAVTSTSLDALVRMRLPQDSLRPGSSAEKLESDGVVLSTGERIAASGVIDARGPDSAMPGLELGWQKFVGVELIARAKELDCATIMDACVEQTDGYRFFYTLPLAEDRVLVEDTYYSDRPDLDIEGVASEVRRFAAGQGLMGDEVRREHGVLPIVIGGNPDVFWPSGDFLPRLGLRGGFFHPTTGYSFSLALQMADALANLEGELDTHRLAAWTRGRFFEHWRSCWYFRLLNRMMFRAGPPEHRYRVFQHFYRCSPELIARFYAGVPSAADKLRLLSGRPPVPIAGAIAAVLGRGQRE